MWLGRLDREAYLASSSPTDRIVPLTVYRASRNEGGDTNAVIAYAGALDLAMVQSVAKLLGQSIDYAGTFAPASLSLEEALDRYVEYCSGPEKWIVSRFCCAADSLHELAKLLSKADSRLAVPVSVVAPASSGEKSWEERLTKDAAAMNEFDRATPEGVEIVAYETRLPGAGSIRTCLNDLKGFAEAELFVEIPWSDDLVDTLAAFCDCDWAFVKVRMGGDVLPGADAVSQFIRECASLDLPCKLTAGLHNPISGPAGYGFVNVFGAMALAVAEDAPGATLSKIVTDSDRCSWHFDDSGLRYGDLRADLDAIEEARGVLLSFGSCSVQEPLEGLASVGIATRVMR